VGQGQCIDHVVSGEAYLLLLVVVPELETLGMVTRDTVFVLVLEDLHWSDASTVKWLAAERLQDIERRIRARGGPGSIVILQPGSTPPG
jgi:hypothetical protein